MSYREHTVHSLELHNMSLVKKEKMSRHMQLLTVQPYVCVCVCMCVYKGFTFPELFLLQEA